VKQIVQRYLIASGGFGVAALMSGVALVSAFVCLLVFALTLLAVGLRQRRQVALKRRRAPHSEIEHPRRRPRAVNTREVARSPVRPRSRNVHHDDEGTGDEWHPAAEYGW
jgi:hypothetical protein